MTTAARERLIVVGTGGRPYREYALEALTARYEIGLLVSEAPSWQLAYTSATAVVNVEDPSAIVDATRTLAGDVDRFGLLTWDETLLAASAAAAEQMGVPHMSPEAVASCRDKYRTREALADAGIGAVRHRLVRTAAEAVAAGEEFGYPVVLKPRALAGSVGVVRADAPTDVERFFAMTAGARFATLPAGEGVLVEEYLDGPEISIDSVACDGEVRCVHIARKRLGFPPFFEEVGHLVADCTLDDWYRPARDLVEAAHHALRVVTGVTHAEVRLTAAGPRLVELNGRLGGDLIPLLGRLSTGIDLVVAAAEIALGRRPDLTPTHRRTAEVRFLYPPHDCVVNSVDVSDAATTPGIERAVALTEPGATLLLPPRAVIPRLAALIAVSDGERECGEALDQAVPRVATDLDATGTTLADVGAGQS